VNKTLISDFQIDLIEKQIENLEISSARAVISELIGRLKKADSVILFYSKPGNVIGTYLAFSERNSENPSGPLIKIGSCAEEYFSLCKKQLLTNIDLSEAKNEIRNTTVNQDQEPKDRDPVVRQPRSRRVKNAHLRGVAAKRKPDHPEEE
jgi:hypothetical protein